MFLEMETGMGLYGSLLRRFAWRSVRFNQVSYD